MANETGGTAVTDQTASTAATDQTTSTASTDQTTAAVATDQTATTTTEAKPYWADDWRERLAAAEPEKNREATLTRLKRFQSPENVFKSWRQLETAISSGQYKPTLKEGATPEEIAAYRKDIGVPEAPEGYLAGELPGGYVIGEEDKPRASQYAQLFHRLNVPDAAAKEIIAATYEEQETKLAQLAEFDKQARADTEHNLRVEWGHEFDGNMKAIRAFAEGTGMKPEEFLQARLPDGSTFISNPAIMKWLVHTATELNPYATLAPSTAGDMGQSITAEIAAIRATMGDPHAPYWKDGGVTEKRYTQLLNAQERMAGNKAA